MYLYSRARAVTVNDWSLRILQELGVAERVKEDMDIARSVTWRRTTTTSCCASCRPKTSSATRRR